LNYLVPVPFYASFSSVVLCFDCVLFLFLLKCFFMQDDYEEDGEVGKLDCGHGFHIQCIKQWLGQKNTCPVCKTEPVGRG
jgi:hypothetical protein